MWELPGLEVAVDGSIARVTLSRPDKLNALNVDLFKALEAHIADLEAALAAARGQAGRRAHTPNCRAAKSFMISSEPPPIIITLTSR